MMHDCVHDLAKGRCLSVRIAVSVLVWAVSIDFDFCGYINVNLVSSHNDLGCGPPTSAWDVTCIPLENLHGMLCDEIPNSCSYSCSWLLFRL